MKRFHSRGLVILGVTLVCGCGMGPVGVAAAALTAPTQCTRLLQGGEYHSIVVPRNAYCVLLQVHVLGDVRVLRRGRLTDWDYGGSGGVGTVIDGDVVAHTAVQVSLIGGVHVGGDFRSKNSVRADLYSDFEHNSIIEVDGDVIIAGSHGRDPGVIVYGSTIRGNVRIRHTVGFEFSSNTVDGDVVIRHNGSETHERAEVRYNTVGKSMTVSHWTGSKSKSVQVNSVTTVLRCHANDSPFFGSVNEAQRFHGQCSE